MSNLYKCHPILDGVSWIITSLTPILGSAWPPSSTLKFSNPSISKKTRRSSCCGLHKPHQPKLWVRHLWDVWSCPTSLSWDSDQAWALVLMAKKTPSSNFSELSKGAKKDLQNPSLGDVFLVETTNPEKSSPLKYFTDQYSAVNMNPWDYRGACLLRHTGLALSHIWPVALKGRFFAAVGEIWGTIIRMDYRSDTI